MRTAFTRRTSAIALAGVLALAGTACGDDAGVDEGGVVETENGGIVDEETAVDTGSTETEDAGLTDEGETEMSTEMDMGTETETAG